MQNNQSIMQISENKDGSAKVLFRIRKAEMTDVDEIMAVMHEAKNDKDHPDWFVSDDEEYVRTHIEEHYADEALRRCKRRCHKMKNTAEILSSAVFLRLGRLIRCRSLGSPGLPRPFSGSRWRRRRSG